MSKFWLWQPPMVWPYVYLTHPNHCQTFFLNSWYPPFWLFNDCLYRFLCQNSVFFRFWPFFSIKIWYIFVYLGPNSLCLFVRLILYEKKKGKLFLHFEKNRLKIASRINISCEFHTFLHFLHIFDGLWGIYKFINEIFFLDISCL